MTKVRIKISVKRRQAWSKLETGAIMVRENPVPFILPVLRYQTNPVLLIFLISVGVFSQIFNDTWTDKIGYKFFHGIATEQNGKTPVVEQILFKYCWRQIFPLQGKLSRSNTPKDWFHNRLFSFLHCLFCFSKQATEIYTTRSNFLDIRH